MPLFSPHPSYTAHASRWQKNLIRTLTQIPTDPDNSEDVDTNAEDHAYDALRYGMNRVESRFNSATRYIKG